MTYAEYRKMYAKARTEDERALALAGMKNKEMLGEKITDKTPETGDAENMSDYTGDITGRLQTGSAENLSDITDEEKGTGSLTEYEARVKELTDELTNREEFNYDTDTDPLYASAKKQYIREGKRATEDTLGAASAATGGRVSSYAAAAATQAGDYYNSQFSDKLQDLYESAYNKYLQEYNLKLQDLSANQELLDYEYGKTRDAESDKQWQTGYDYQKERDSVSDKQYSDNVEYQKLLDAWEQSQTEKEYNYNVSADEWEKQYNMAVLAAEYGDYSLLKKMGIDTTAYQAMQASSGSSGGGGSGGSSKKSSSATTTTEAKKATAQRGVNTMNTVMSADDTYYNNVKASSHYGQYSVTNKSDWNTLVNAMNTGIIKGSVDGNTITVKDDSGKTYKFYYDTTDSFTKSKLYGTTDEKATGYYA